MGEDHQEKNCHQLGRVQRQDDPLWTVRKVITKEAEGAGAPPLFLKDYIITVVLEIEEKSAGKTTDGSLDRTCRRIRDSAECKRCREMSARHHGPSTCTSDSERPFYLGVSVVFAVCSAGRCSNSS